jgi:hypothetical protein
VHDVKRTVTDRSELRALFRVFAARAICAGQDRPAAVGATCDGFTEHATHQRPAAPAATWAGANAGAFAHLFEGFGAALDRFDDRAFANFIAQAGWFEVLNDRLGFGILL